MKKFEIDNMNTKSGRLIYSTTKSKKPLNKKNLISGLAIYFNSEEQATRATKVVLENRETVEKVKLKRTINKNNISLI